jgi:hypothetical protein
MVRQRSENGPHSGLDPNEACLGPILFRDLDKAYEHILRPDAGALAEQCQRDRAVKSVRLDYPRYRRVIVDL